MFKRIRRGPLRRERKVKGGLLVQGELSDYVGSGGNYLGAGGVVKEAESETKERGGGGVIWYQGGGNEGVKYHLIT